jgi:uncharacterized protein (DUF433 family)
MANEHPLITLTDGPAGPRPRLVGTGLDVWEAIWVVRDNDGDEREAAAYLRLPVDLVTAAVAYYDVHEAEIDEWIELNARESEAEYAAWLAGRALTTDQRRPAAMSLSAPFSNRSNAACTFLRETRFCTCA